MMQSDDECGGERDYPIILFPFPYYRRRAPRKMTFLDRDSALGLLDWKQNPALEIQVPFLMASDDSSRDREKLVTYLRRFIWLLTEDEESAVLMEWVARARPEETPGDVLLWLWDHWRPGQGPLPLQSLFSAIASLAEEADLPLFRDGTSFHTYLIAQLEANDYRVVEVYVMYEALYRAVMPLSVVSEYLHFPLRNTPDS